MRRRLRLAVLAGWLAVAGVAGLAAQAQAQDGGDLSSKLSLDALTAPPPGGYRPTPHRSAVAHGALARPVRLRGRHYARVYRARVYHARAYRRPLYRPVHVRRVVARSGRYRSAD